MIRYKSFHKKITAALKHNMHICPQIWENVSALLGSQGVPVKAQKESASSSSVKKGVSAADGAPVDQETVDAEALALANISPTKGSRTVEGKISEAYWQVDDLSVTALTEYLNAVNPISLSLENLRRVCTRGQRDKTRRLLCDILEFATNIERTFQISGDLRVKTQFNNAFAEHCRAEAERLGNRASRLMLPPLWDHSGIYLAKERDADLFIEHRFLQKEVMLPAESHHGWEPRAPFIIEYNYSENQAKLKLPSGRLSLLCMFGEVSGVNCCNLGPAQEIGVKRVLALQDTGSPKAPQRRVRQKQPLALEYGAVAAIGESSGAGPSGASGSQDTSGAQNPCDDDQRDQPDADDESEDEICSAPPPPGAPGATADLGDEADESELMQQPSAT